MIESNDLARAVAAAIEELPDEQREAVILKEYQGLSFPEIAEVIGVPVSTVKTRLYRALGQLRVSLVDKGLAPSPSLEKNHGLHHRS
jgi:RNA polymerase sigma-70 factor (ECF subfamily)